MGLNSNGWILNSLIPHLSFSQFLKTLPIFHRKSKKGKSYKPNVSWTGMPGHQSLLLHNSRWTDWKCLQLAGMWWVKLFTLLHRVFCLEIIRYYRRVHGIMKFSLFFWFYTGHSIYQDYDASIQPLAKPGIGLESPPTLTILTSGSALVTREKNRVSNELAEWFTIKTGPLER